MRARHTHSPIPKKGLLAGYARADGGAAAVEFAMIALPLLALITGIIELALIFLISSTLETSMEKMSRTIRTGTFQGANLGAADLKASICSNLGWLQSDCMANLYLDVRTYGQFSDIAQVNPVTNGQFDATKLQFQTGQASTIEVVHAYYVWSLITPAFNGGLQTISGGKTLIQATTAFRNEAYG